LTWWFKRSFFDGISFDFFAFNQDCLVASEDEMLGEGCDLGFEVLFEEAIFE